MNSNIVKPGKFCHLYLVYHFTVPLKELLYADDRVLYGESLNEVMDKYGRWKNAGEWKSLRVNVDKTKGMQLLFRKKSSVSKVYPCGVCGERVGCNSMQCTKCQRWAHHRCSAPG